MKKILLAILALIIFITPATNVFADEPVERISVVTVSAVLYATDDISAPLKDGNNVIRVNHGEEFDVIEETATGFYKISYQSAEAYILKAYVMDCANKSLNVKLDTNANINADCKVYELNGEDFIETSFNLKKGTRVKVLDGEYTTKGYSRISFEDNQKIYTYYVNKNALSLDGLSAGVITAISMIIVCISIILILFGLKGRKKRKKNIA